MTWHDNSRLTRLQVYCICVAFILLSTSANALPQPLNSVVHTLKDAIPQPIADLASAWKDFSLLRRDNSSTSGNGSENVASSSQNPNASAVWVLQDTYAGETFFDDWTFWTGADPTHGLVDYLDHDSAVAQNLTYVTSDNVVIMKGDDTNWLPLGQNRSSVRIQSNKTYTGGLFILDLNRAPWGCGVWPAFWTLGATATWPQEGEIDIIEGVHDNVHNQVTWHTLPGCVLEDTGNFTGTLVGQTDCDASLNSNAGCGITDWSRVSYGETFDAQGGGIYAMLWDETGIAVWYFYRVSIPQDILDGVPEPKSWVTPSAALSPGGCDPFKYFNNHAMVFDITFCGDWAGNTYETTPGCTGTCPEHLQDPSNFVNASWSINSLKVYRKQALTASVSNGAPPVWKQLHWSTVVLSSVMANVFLFSVQ